MSQAATFPGAELPWHPLHEVPEPWTPGPGGWVMLAPPEMAIWVRPNPELDDGHDVLIYGLTFNGYDYCRDVVHRDCAKLAQAVVDRRERQGHWAGSFADLRCTLFFTQRAAHWADMGRGPDDDHVLGLNRAICETWEREWQQHRPRAPWRGRPLGFGDL